MDFNWPLDVPPGAERQREDNVTLRGTLPRWAILIIVGLVGAIFVTTRSILGPAVDHGVWAEVCDVLLEIGKALITACVLGFSIELWMMSDLAKDVFFAAMGYFLPKEFRREVARIANYEWLGVEALLIVELSVIPEDMVELKASSTRTLKNISGSTKSLRAWTTVDEFDLPSGRSRVLLCQVEKPGEIIKSGIDHKSSEHSVECGSDEVTIKPGKTGILRYQTIEYKRLNDLAYWSWLSPTKDQEVEIRAPEELDFTVRFGNDGPIRKEDFSTRQTMEGIHLPYQHLGIRWWPKRTEL